ncbi:MAG: hypothetical protein IKQ29_02360 [Bacilli bacterium]|nr:hypothetical protein [Bacilli bacterium]
MKKKVLLIIGLLFILTGCTSEVTITITEDRIVENINIDNYPGGGITKNDIKNGYRHFVPAYFSTYIADSEPDERRGGAAYYIFSMNELGNGYRINYKYDFPMEKYYDSRALKEAYTTSSVIDDGQYLTIETSEKNQYLFSYPELTKLTINIVVPYVVVDSNADSCSGKKCTWIYTPSSNSKKIYIKMRKPTSSNQNPVIIPDDNKDNNNNSNNNNENNNENNAEYKPGVPAEYKESDSENMIDYNPKDYNDEEDEEEKTKYIWVIIIFAIICFLIAVVVVNKKNNK